MIRRAEVGDARPSVQQTVRLDHAAALAVLRAVMLVPGARLM